MLDTVDPQTEVLDADQLCGHLVAEHSIHRKLAVLGDKLFADFYDSSQGRHSVPPSLLAKVSLLQSLEGTSDRETVERVCCDLRWKVALKLLLDHESFHPTVLTYSVSACGPPRTRGGSSTASRRLRPKRACSPGVACGLWTPHRCCRRCRPRTRCL